MVRFDFEVVGSRLGGTGESRDGGSSEKLTPSIRRGTRRGPPRPHSDALVNDAADGLKRTGINGSQRIFDQDFIPEWLILNILIRLPLKFVVTCKLVCKQWASLISNPFFVRSYLAHSSSPSWTAIQERVQLIDPQTIRLLEYHLRRNFGDLCLPTAHECNTLETFEVFGASNGLILFGLKCHYTVTCSLFYVCNPVTRKLVSLSTLPHEYLDLAWRAGSGFVARVSDAAVLESFRVVLLVQAKQQLLSVVYASETREWSDFPFPGDKSSGEDVLEKNPTALDGVLHWETRDGSIVAYDPYKEPSHIRVVAPPEDLDSREGADDTELRCRCMIDASAGKLRYLERSVVGVDGDRPAVRLRTWVLEDECGWCASSESDDTSILVGVYRLPCLVLSSLTPMFFDPFDSGVVYLVILGVLLSYDFWSGEFRVVKSAPNRWAFVLELSPWPISIEP